MKITEIFKQFGEPGFRDIETEMIKNFLKTKMLLSQQEERCLKAGEYGRPEEKTE